MGMMNTYLENHVQIKDIPGWTGYHADNFGVIYTSKKFEHGRFRLSDEFKAMRTFRAGIRGHERTYVSLYSNGKKKNFTVARLVAMAFLPTRPEGMELCHNDGDEDNNRISNLRWDTHANNMKDVIRHGTVQRGDNHWSRRRLKAC